MEPKKIIIKGAKEHNLKNIYLEIPKKKFIVFTGVSGSGKSSLAFDILYAEGQRRYVESLSSYARQFLGQMPKPHYEYIRGLSPSISIEQKAASKNPRSTVGTVTEIYDYLRILFSNIGKQYCINCGDLVSKQSASEIVKQIKQEFEGDIQVYSPIISNRKGEFKDLLDGFILDGYLKIQIDGNEYDLGNSTPKLNKKQKHNIELLIDVLNLNKCTSSRLNEAIETGLKYGHEVIKVKSLKSNTSKFFSQKQACLKCGISFKPVSPQSFSFNSPIGMCEECNGLGYRTEVDPKLLIPDENISINNGAVAIWSDSTIEGEGWDGAIISSLIAKYNINPDIPWRDLPNYQKQIILYGTGAEKINVSFTSKKESNNWQFSSSYSGIIPKLLKKFRESTSEKVRNWYGQFMREMSCNICNGTRLKEQYRFIKIADKSIIDLTGMTVKKLNDYINQLTLTGNDKHIADEILKEIKSRLKFLLDVGLDYLTLNRRAPSLSGGESQRIRLASQIGSELSGVLYILDEPSIGLHQRDNSRLINSLKHLRNLGNTVIVIEHDEETIKSSDYIVDFGPKAGIKGGEIVAVGTLKTIIKSKNSITGSYLSGKYTIDIPKKRRPGNGYFIELIKPCENNLKIDKVVFPLNKIICVTGVSGAGKSSLINNILVPAIQDIMINNKNTFQNYYLIKGVEHINKIINIDQKPIGKSSRSNPATYTKVYDYIREFFAELPESKLRGYNPGRFSFNVKGGRCEACQGAGNILVEMHFLPDVYVECEVCNGKRFNDSTLEVLYKSKNIADILNTSVLEAYEIFNNIPKIKSILKTLIDVGMDYVALGQPSTTLSGGEAQRIKLSRELCKPPTGKTLYVLDEPTTGLHFDDIKKLLSVINLLADQGNTIIVIEHNLDVIKTADHIIDLGPEGGEKGGEIVAEGTPEEIANNIKSYTGYYLKKYHFK